ncbi:hypothetical protein FACS1894116_13730 [Betaproteobacteria bacterium]|nr:hypothetical protein FACS1894116_13730 [Betaproteobacteria bacterium]GHU00461.1 hypothetical protein FACS1894154_09510 [Betaproteobacteria bacterium]GHU29451.1 hypothetical protein FACS189497_07460 [Betaproteobacteria bacterium]
MSRITHINPTELSADLQPLFHRYAVEYGAFGNQASVLAHVPPAFVHLTSMLTELKHREVTPWRYIELAIVTVSRLNACTYCVSHHTPVLETIGVSPQAAAQVLEYETVDEFDEIDRVVIEYAIAVTRDARRVSDVLFARLRQHFSEEQVVELTLRIGLCGFFNRFNDALRIEIEDGVLPL